MDGYGLGDVAYIYEVCGSFLGDVQLCPRCEDQAEKGCGLYFAVAIIRGEPEHPNRPKNIIASIDIAGCPFE